MDRCRAYCDYANEQKYRRYLNCLEGLLGVSGI